MANAERKPQTGGNADHIVRDIVDAGRVLVHHRLLDAFGHVSARHPDIPDRFLLPKRIAPGLVEREDVRQYGLDGELIEADGSPTFVERYIHAAIYAARPDVHAVVHCHAPTLVAYSVLAEPALRPVCHTCGFLSANPPVYEIRDVAGDATDLLIRDLHLGRTLADSLGSSAAVLMRGHGATFVGTSIPQAVYRSIFTDVNARVQAMALQLGDVRYLSDGEIAAIGEGGDLQIERTWQVWRNDVASSS